MENKNIYYPAHPKNPVLLELHETNLFKLIYRSKYFIICSILYYYWMYVENDFESIYIYYTVIGFYVLRRIWPALIQNGDLREKNKKMIDSYDKDVIQYEKSLKEYYFSKNKMEVERVNRTKAENQRRIEFERQNWEKLEEQKRKEVVRQKSLELNRQKRKEVEIQKSLELNIQSSSEVERHFRLELNRLKSLEGERQNKLELERQKKPTVIIPEVQRKVEYDKIKERWKSQPASTSKDSTIIKKTDNLLELEINNTIKNYSAICAALAIQPVPFADIFILTPTQILMGKKIASLRGYEIKENSIESILKEISGIIGMGIIAQQLVIGAYKTFLPFLGGFTTIPVVYGLTYGIGKTMDYYILAKINGTQINKREIEKIFKSSRSIGEREGKAKEKDIHAKSKTNDNKI